MMISRNSDQQKRHCTCNTNQVEVSLNDVSVSRPSITPFGQTFPMGSHVPPSASRGASRRRDASLEFLKRALSSEIERKSLYALPNDRANEIIDDLEHGSREDSNLCIYHRERFFTMLRKMCAKHRLLPTSYATTEELKKVEDLPRTGGGSADVWYGVYQGSRVAIKVLRVNSGVDLRTVEMNFCREVVLWKQLRHPNLLPLVGAAKSSHILMMVSEWMENGTIMDFITACREADRLKLLTDVARGLKYLHDWPSVHADLKSSNILIDSDFSARIADFGLTSALRSHPMSISVTAQIWGGTFRWMAPELFNEDQRPSKASDIYALGMVIYEVFAHENPFSQVPSLLVPGLVSAGERPTRPPNREIFGLSDDVWMLAEKCWDGDPAVRPYIADIFSFFEAASRRWVPPTSAEIANLFLGFPTICKPLIRKSTTIMSAAVLGDEGTASGASEGTPPELTRAQLDLSNRR